MSSTCSSKRKRINIEPIITVIAILLSAVMVVAGLIIRTETAHQNDVNVELSSKLDELREENTRLKIAVDSAYDLGDLEDAARNELGMLPPGAEETAEIDVKKEDKATVLGDREDGDAIKDNWISSLRNIFSWLK